MMLSFLRGRVSATHLLAVGALVFAMAGGAFAATGRGPEGSGARAAAHKNHKAGKAQDGYVITSAKQIKPTVLKQLQGARGAQGERGPAGSNGVNGGNGQSVTIASLAAGNGNCPFGGAGFTGLGGSAYACNGAEGKPGTPGKAGAAGEGVTVASLLKGSEPNPGSECKELGGAKITNEAETETAFACNGAESKGGSGGGGHKLEPGETETGTWAVGLNLLYAGGPYHEGFVAISFQLPLSAAPAFSVIGVGKPSTTNCPGSAAEPKATEEHLCLYMQEQENASPEASLISTVGASSTGDVVRVVNEHEGYAFGTWAVTG